MQKDEKVLPLQEQHRSKTLNPNVPIKKPAGKREDLVQLPLPLKKEESE